MKKILTTMLLLMTFTLYFGEAMGESKISISGQVRVRSELDSRSFDSSRTIINTCYLRTRLNLKAEINDNAFTYIQFQDSRRLGDNTVFGQAASGGLNDGHNVDLHQAYLQVNHLWNNGIGVRAGRFEVIHGNQRVFGAVGWSNVGRTWEGANFFHTIANTRLNAYWLRKMEQYDETRNSDFDIFGINADIRPWNLELFAFVENDAFQPNPSDTIEVTGVDTTFITYSGTHNQLQRITLGMYYHREYKQFDVIMNAAYQLGTMQAWKDTSTKVDTSDFISEEHDIAAAMATFEVGYTLKSKMQPRLAVGIDYSSGDNNRFDTDHHAYDNLYYTGHKFRGAMDYFIGSGDAGLIDMMFRARFDPLEGWTLAGDFHYFKTAADYVYNSKKVTDVGMELDLSLSTDKISGINFVVGGSIFMPEEAYAGMPDPETGYWGYFMMTANF